MSKQEKRMKIWMLRQEALPSHLPDYLHLDNTDPLKTIWWKNLRAHRRAHPNMYGGLAQLYKDYPDPRIARRRLSRPGEAFVTVTL